MADDFETLPPPEEEGRREGAQGALPGRIGPYRVERMLGQGGMGEVFLAWDDSLRRKVAVKRVSAPHRDVAEARARFWREARALAALGHPGIVTIYQIGETDEGDLFIAMELIEGRALSTALDSPWPPALVAWLGREVASALGAAHRAGITHRDVKPGNLLVTAAGSPRVVDFGLARRAGASEDQVTGTGTVVGTPAYMSPEQLEGAEVGPETDVFAVGILLYRLLTGAHPFARESRTAMAMAISGGIHKPLAEVMPELPAALAEAVTRCLRADPAQRYADGAALAEALDAALDALGVQVKSSDLAGFLADASQTGPQPVNLETRAAGATAESRRVSWPRVAALVAAGALVAVLLISVWIVGKGPEMADHDGPVVDAETPAVAARPALRADALPPKPVVAVLGFDGASPRDAAVLSDALQVYLDGAPERLVSVPRQAVEARWGPGAALSTLATPGRRLGHVDVAIDGSLSRSGDALRAEIRVRETSGGAVLTTWTASASDPVELARLTAAGFLEALGVDAGALPALTRSIEAYETYLQARAAADDGDAGATRENLKWSLMRDPGFLLAEVERLDLLRAERRMQDLAKAAARLAQRGAQLPSRLGSLVEVWLAYAEGRSRDAVRAAHAHLERWPWDVDAYEVLLALRFNDHKVQDLGEVEKLATALLKVAPRHEGAASRLTRALAFRGRGEEVPQLLSGLGVARDEPRWEEVWAEVDLYAGDFQAAIAGFQRAVARSQSNIYAEHMGFAAQILAGQCEQAALSAMGRIERVRTLGKDQNLDWTYSLAIQALMCDARWSQAALLLDTWAKRSASGAQHRVWLEPRMALAQGDRDKALRLAQERLAELGPDASDAPVLMTVLARTLDDLDALEAHLRIADERAVDVTSTVLLRGSYLRAAQALKARALLVGGETEQARKAYDDLVFPWSGVSGEGLLGARVEAMVLRAEALETLGEGAAALKAWRQVLETGYPRLWSSDLWVLAKRRVAALSVDAEP